jgi:hypothetical protein
MITKHHQYKPNDKRSIDIIGSRIMGIVIIELITGIPKSHLGLSTYCATKELAYEHHERFVPVPNFGYAKEPMWMSISQYWLLIRRRSY